MEGLPMVKKISFILAFFLLAPNAFSENAKTYISKGKEWAKMGDYKKAIKEYNEALVLEPDNVEAHLFLGLAYADSGNLDRAVTHAQRASQIQPSYTSFYNLGLVHAARDDAPAALQAFEEALRFNPKSFIAEYQKGLAHNEMRDYEKASVAFQRSLELNPRFGDARLALGAALYQKGDKADASRQVAELRKAKRKDLADALEAWLKEKEAPKKLSTKP